MFKFATVLTITAVIVSGFAVQGATLERRACSGPDETKPVCQTTDGSPSVDDCTAALGKLSGQCHQYNNVGSTCTSMVTVGTCKIDVCGFPGAELVSGVNCGGYLEPASCNVAFGDQPYKLQFSHS